MNKFNPGDIVKRVKNFHTRPKDEIITVKSYFNDHSFLSENDTSGWTFDDNNFELVIPAKWCLKRTIENYEVINNWFRKTHYTHLSSHYGYVHNKTSTIVVAQYNIQEGYKEISFDDFKKYILKEEIKETVIIEKKERKLSIQNYRKIYNIACSTWKEKLQEMYGQQFALSDEIIIPENDYKKMRIACNTSQNILFDEIFGKDEIIPQGTPCLVKEKLEDAWLFRYSDGEGRFTSDKENFSTKYTWNYVHPIPEISNNLPPC